MPNEGSSAKQTYIYFIETAISFKSNTNTVYKCEKHTRTSYKLNWTSILYMSESVSVESTCYFRDYLFFIGIC